MKTRNPIPKAVRLIKPKVVPNKHKNTWTKKEVDELHNYADKMLKHNNRKTRS